MTTSISIWVTKVLMMNRMSKNRRRIRRNKIQMMTIVTCFLIHLMNINQQRTNSVEHLTKDADFPFIFNSDLLTYAGPYKLTQIKIRISVIYFINLKFS